MDNLLFLRNEVVAATDDCKMMPSYKNFRKNDDSTNKRFLQDALTFTYFAFSRSSYIAHLGESQRYNSAVTYHCTRSRKLNDFLDNKWCMEFIADYIDHTRTDLQKIESTLKKDISDYLNDLNKIPNLIVSTESVCLVEDDGKWRQKRPGDNISVLNNVNIEVEVQISNKQQKMSALKESKTLITLSKEIEKMTKEEALQIKVRKGSQKIHLFERPK